jgi:flagellar L-ring protein precursor FlgH
MKTILFNILFSLLLIEGAAYSQDLGKAVSLFTDTKSVKIGQGITVLIMEYSKADNDARTESNKNSQHAIDVGQSTGILGMIPSTGISGNIRNDFRGDSRTSREGELKAKIAAKIVGQNEAGDFLIKGSKVIEINSEKEVMSIEGAVRQRDISAENTVFSYNIYNAHIVYKGKGEVSRAQKSGFLTRFLQWVF